MESSLAEKRQVLGSCILKEGGEVVVFSPAKGKKSPDLLVFATDGYGPAPSSSSIPTIWLITEGGQAPATFGETIMVDDLVSR